MIIAFFLSLLLPVSVAADENGITPLPTIPVAEASDPAPLPSGETHYELSRLHPVGISAYPTEKASVLRHYFQFHNSDGNHFLVYEEDSLRPPVREVQALGESMRAWKATCSAQLTCRAKAFCTGKCENMYYQTSNLEKPGDGNRCQLNSFSCFRAKDGPEAAPPVPAGR